MAVAFDNSGVTDSGNVAVATLTSASFTMGSGANRWCIVILAFESGTTPASLVVNWNTSEALTAIPGAVLNDATNSNTVIAFGRVNPTSGSHTFSASWTGSLFVEMGFISGTGADQTGGTTTFAHGRSNSGTSASLSTGAITSAINNLCVGGYGSGSGITTVTPGGESSAWLDNTRPNSGGNYKAGAASVTLTATQSPADFFGAVGIDVVAASGGIIWGFEQLFQPSRLISGWRAGAIMRGDDGIQDIRRNWVNGGWEVQPHQPPHPKPEQRAAGIMKGDDGTQDIRRNWVNNGWEIQPPQPPHPVPEKRAAGVMRGDDGTQDIKRNWQNAGWEIQPPQPPHPRPEQHAAGAIIRGDETPMLPSAKMVTAFYEQIATQPVSPKWSRAAAIMRGDDGAQAQFSQWVNDGWEIQSVQPPHPAPERRAAGVMRWPDGIDQPFLQWVNAGWEIQPHQPLHPRFERSGAIVRSEDILVGPPTVTWGFEQTPFQLRPMRWAQAGSLMRGDDGAQAQFPQWVNDGWEIQSVQPPHPRPERFGAISRGDDGTQAVFVPPSGVVLGFESILPILAMRLLRYPAIEGRNEFLASSVLPWVEDLAWQPFHTRFERAAALMRGDDGLTTFLTWLNAGWEVQPPQPPHLRPERFGSVVRGDDGTQAVFVPPAAVPFGFESILPILAIKRSRYAAIEGLVEFLSSGVLPWVEDLAWQPYRWPSWRAAATQRGHDGTDAVFVPPVVTAWGYEAPFAALRIPRRNSSLRGDDGTQAQFAQWVNAGWEIQPVQPPHPVPEKRAAGAMRGDDGTQVQFAQWVNNGWEIQPPQPPHPKPEQRAAGAMRGDDGTQAQLILLRDLEWPSPYVFPRTRPERSGAIQRGHDGIEFPRQIFPTGWEVQPFQPPHFGRERTAALMRGDDGLTTFLNWRNAGWEIQSFQPSHFGRERSAGLMRGDEGTQATFLQWRNAGWEIQPVQPPHFGRERQAAAILRGDDGTQAQFGFFRLLEWPAPPMYRRPPTVLMGALARGDDGLVKFIQGLSVLFAGVGGLAVSAALIKHICVFPGRGVVSNPTEPPGSGGNTTVSGRGVASNPSVSGPGAKVC